ncbi:MAG: MFS transporter [Acidimicrobiales bacterium]
MPTTVVEAPEPRLAAAAPQDDSDPKRFRALAVIALAQLMIVLDASVVIVALPSAQHALHMSVADRQWVVTCYTLAFGTLLLLGGRLADYLGRRRMFIIGLLGFAVSSALGGMAQDAAMLFGARALQGAFAAVMAPAALSLLTTTFTETKERARAFGVYGAISGGGAAIGLVLGGALTQFASWRWVLLINVPIAIFAAISARRVVHESRGAGKGSYDLIGAAMVTGALFMLVYGFSTAGTNGWSAPTTLALLAAAVVSLGLFVVIELRSAHPLFAMRVVLDRNRGGSFLASLLVGCALLGTFLFLTYFFQGTLHYSVLKTGFAFVPFSIGIVVGATFSSRLLPRVGPRALMLAGLTAAALGLVLFTRVTADSSYLTLLLPAELIVSVGMGATFVPMNSTALVGVEPKDAGMASALVNTTQQVGNSLGTALLNTVAASAAASFVLAHPHVSDVSRSALVHGYTTGFSVSAGLVLAAAVTVGLLVKARRSDVAPGTDEELSRLLEAATAEVTDEPDLVLNGEPA